MIDLNAHTLPLFGAISLDGIKAIDAAASLEDVVGLMINYRYTPDAKLAKCIAAMAPGERADLFLKLSKVFNSHIQTTGKHVSPLYRDFPNHTILELEERFIGAALMSIGIQSQYDPAKYGADPVTGYQTSEFGADARADGQNTITLGEGAKKRDLRILTLAGAELLASKTKALLESLLPLSPAETCFISFVIGEGHVAAASLSEVKFREKIPLLRDIFSIEDYARACNSVTDALRLARVFSGHDAGTAHAVRFRLTTAQAKKILFLVEEISKGNSDLETDFIRHEEAWKRLAEHMRAKRFENRFPTAVSALNDLRSGKMKSWQSRFVNAPLLDKIKIGAERPGVFVRSIAALGREIDDASLSRNTAPEEEALMSAARATFPKVDPLKLIQLHVFLEKTTRREDRFHVMPSGRIMTSTAKPLAMEPIREILEDHLHGRLDGLIDFDVSPVAENRFVPAGNRTASDADIRSARGDRVKLDFGPDDVERLFLHWHHSCDVDLSAAFYDANQERCGECSYFRLETEGYATHSGDILDGSQGAAEYVDINVGAARDAGARFVIMTANVFSGGSFSDFPAYAGMMIRDGETGAHFEIETVQSKLKLSGETRVVTPAMLDLETGELIYVDMPGNWAAGSNISSRSGDLANIMRFYSDYGDYRPSFATLLRFAGTDGAQPITEADIIAQRDEILARLSAA